MHNNLAYVICKEHIKYIFWQVYQLVRVTSQFFRIYSGREILTYIL